ncbi:MAG TPA: acyl-CoA dehydrogenase [Nocardioidaceae bacterium]|nr:acyl-CoA dehydrogenase [Nocardioidaceae bacterium]
MGLSEEQAALASSLAAWAADREFAEVVRRAESEGPAALLEAWHDLADLGILGIGAPESLGGAGGTLLDLACALEAAAAGLVTGPLLSTATAAALLSEHVETTVAKRVLPAICDGSVRVGLAARPAPLTVTDDGATLSGTVPVVLDVATATHLLLGAADGPDAGPVGGRGDVETWFLVPLDTDGVSLEVSESGPDLSRTVGAVRLSDVSVTSDERLEVQPVRVRDLLLVLAAAEASGTARWALRTAVEYAGVREQFGRKIGSFQAVKHLCAQMLERSESATAVAWDAASAHEAAPRQLGFAAAVGGAVALDAAVENVKDCIQVLGGIGFTWEHEAHLHLRRALSTRQLVGGTDRLRLGIATLALDGVRRRPNISLGEGAEQLRQSIRAEVRRVAEAHDDARRTALVEAGLLTPHWPQPYGRGADPREQLVIDEELAAAGISRPDLGVGAWAAPTILGHGTDSQKKRFLTATLRGDIVWCQLFSEPGAGSDLASLRTKAERVDDGWSLTGQKVWTSLAKEAHWGICLARTNAEAPPHKGITYFLVDMRSPGIEIRPLREITGEAVFNEVFLDGVMVPDDCVVGEVDGGWKLARTTLANERVAMSGSSLGVSVERALQTVRPRRDEPAAAAELLRVGGAVADAVTVTMLGARATLRALAGQGPGAESSVQKLVGVRHRQEAAELTYDLLGPEALVGTPEAEEALHELLLTRCLSIAGGTTQILRNVAGERILGLPRS